MQQEEKHRYRILVGGRYDHTTSPMTDTEIMIYVATLIMRHRQHVQHQLVS